MDQSTYLTFLINIGASIEDAIFWFAGIVADDGTAGVVSGLIGALLIFLLFSYFIQFSRRGRDVQEMIYIKREPVMFNLSQSTNLFEKKDGKWLMIFHHASPIPVTENIINDQNIQ